MALRTVTARVQICIRVSGQAPVPGQFEVLRPATGSATRYGRSLYQIGLAPAAQGLHFSVTTTQTYKHPRYAILGKGNRLGSSRWIVKQYWGSSKLWIRSFDEDRPLLAFRRQKLGSHTDLWQCTPDLHPSRGPRMCY